MSEREEERPVLARRRGGRAVLTGLALVAVVAVGVHLLERQVWIHPPAAAPAPLPASLPSATLAADQLEALRQRVAALEQHVAALAATPPALAVAPAPATVPDATAAALSARVDDLTRRLRGDEARIDAAVAGAARQLRVQAAAMALAAGRPLGDVPGAPPTLARFRTEAPPTEAALREAFPAAARAAEQADMSSLGLWQGMRARLTAMIMVRRGDRVVMGSPDVLTLQAARSALEAGDLAGALARLDRLAPAGAAAMAGWRSQAQALLDARAALVAMQGG